MFSRYFLITGKFNIEFMKKKKFQNWKQQNLRDSLPERFREFSYLYFMNVALKYMQQSLECQLSAILVIYCALFFKEKSRFLVNTLKKLSGK